MQAKKKRVLRKAAAAKKFYRLDTLTQMLDAGASTIKDWADDPENDFPQRIQIGPRAVAWIAEEVDSWLKRKIQQGRVAT
ncbi:MAG: AlpA family phage regulatory protein [Gammaproteobacteria bacterium]|jgi:predicted DNA-binding transcriptional regulator AlpA|nr:AlpA family phage regulatory protein [Gammaproteobacteria bacterium]MBT4606347.1 AlpA family phage regulatory protein [Thiotrichales bacterium]MBT4081540.1 AlpA family phage regulatory protein [Gammaproteobacteria bacterium]MBT4331382.1 AlpA family phage regulatory protein [Gammaproteobacteria bacterium]MBT4789012.1 AlpA family phage regulatory protein [Gammaproteobacteria bacterium]